MNRFIRKSLEPGEEIIFNGRLHWTYVVGTILSAWTLMALGLAAIAHGLSVSETTTEGAQTDGYGTTFYIGLALIALGICVRLWAWLDRSRTEFAVTHKRIIQKDGILTVNLTEIPLHKVESVQLTQGILDRMLGTGCIKLIGSGGTMHSLKQICDPMGLRQAIVSNISGDAPEPAPAPAKNENPAEA